MGLSLWLLLVALLCWCAGLAAAIRKALLELDPDAFDVPLPPRLLQPLAAPVAHYVRRRLRVAAGAELMTRLLQAGMDRRVDPAQWLAFKWLLVTLGAGAGAVAALVAGGPARFVPLAAAAAGWLLPDAGLRLRARRRQRRIDADLMLDLDLVFAGIESGLALRDALRLAAECAPPGPMAVALHASLQDACVGCEPDEILRRLQRRLQAPAASTAIAGLLRAAASGAGLRRALQGALARHQRADLARAERCARQTPRRILRPLLACFAPCLFMAAVMPAILRPWVA